MNINVSIIDQQVRGLAQRLKAPIEQELDRPLDETTTRSVAFVVLCAKVVLGLSDAEAIEMLTEGGNDHRRGAREAHAVRGRELHEPVSCELVREKDCAKLAVLPKSKQKENSRRPFIFEEAADGIDWYRIDDSKICAVQIAKRYLKLEHLTTLAQRIADIRDLRNDVAHSEPTDTLMASARRRMREGKLWSDANTFLSQPLVQEVLKELGETHPQELLNNLLKEVRRRLTDTSWEAGATG